MKRISLLLVVCCTGTLFSQQPAASAPQGFGQVNGRVFFNDTGLPARFASIQLVAANPPASPLLNPATMGKHPDFASLMANAMSAIMKGSNLATVTGMDGSFAMPKVPPGTYYLLAQYPGYLSAVSGIPMKERMKADSVTMKAVESLAQKVEVQAGQSDYENISLKRGGVIAGTVTYDDGSPAPGTMLTVLMRDSDGNWKELSPQGSAANDQGQFRIPGLAAGDYAVKATLPVMQSMVGVGTGSIAMHLDIADALVVYSGGALREKDIKPVELTDGQEVDGTDVTFPIHSLYTVSGSVVAKSDGHAVSVGGVDLEDSDTKEVLRSAIVGSDGAFQIHYVPQGSYVLRVSAAGDLAPGSATDTGSLAGMIGLLGAKPTHEYGSMEMPLNLTSDATGLVLQVPDAPAGKSGAAAAGTSP